MLLLSLNYLKCDSLPLQIRNNSFINKLFLKINLSKTGLAYLIPSHLGPQNLERDKSINFLLDHPFKRSLWS